MTEAEKDPGIDDIVKMNIPPEDKVHFIADLAKHRGKCMDHDAIEIKKAVTIIKQQIRQIEMLRHKLKVRSPWDNFKIWMNGWANS
jgi:hypothetical protein